MSQKSIRNLLLITALSSITNGLTLGFISAYIMMLGASNLANGVMSVGCLIGELLSPDVAKHFSHIYGKKYTLFLILNTSMVTHIMMVLTNSYWFTVLTRILFSLTNQCQNICHQLLVNRAETKESKASIEKAYRIASTVGYFLGPITSGYIFPSGFGYIGLLGAFLALVSVWLLMEVEKNTKDAEPEHTDRSVLAKASGHITKSIQEFQKCDPAKHWDVLLLKYLFSGAMIIFFTKFTQMLKYNLQSRSVTIGYTAAYMSIAAIPISINLDVIKSYVQKYPFKYTVEMSFLIISICMLGACYAPLYEVYMILFTAVIILRIFISSLWQDLFEVRKNQYLSQLNSTISTVAGLTIPLLFGVICDQFSYPTVVLFTSGLSFLCWVIVRYHSKNVITEISNNETEESNDSEANITENEESQDPEINSIENEESNTDSQANSPENKESKKDS